MAFLFFHLPQELQLQIFSWIDDFDTFMRVHLVCRKMHALLQEEMICKQIFYNIAKPLRSLIQELDTLQVQSLQYFESPLNVTSPLDGYFKGIKNLKELISKKEPTKQRLTQKLQEISFEWSRGNVVNDYKNFISTHAECSESDIIEKSIPLMNQLRDLYRRIAIHWLRHLSTQKQGKVHCRKAILGYEPLHQLLLTKTKKEEDYFIIQWVRHLADNNSLLFLLTALRQPFFQKLLIELSNERSNKDLLSRITNDQKQLILAIYTDPKLQALKQFISRCSLNIQFIEQHPQVAQHALNQKDCIQHMLPVQFQALCEKYSHTFQLFTLDDFTQRYYCLLTLEPSTVSCLQKIEGEFHHYQQQKDIADFLFAQDCSSFNELLYQITTQGPEYVVSFSKPDGVHPRTVHLLEATRLKTVCLSALTDVSKRQAVMDGTLRFHELLSDAEVHTHSSDGCPFKVAFRFKR